MYYRIDEDLLKAAQRIVSKKIARLRQLAKDLSPGGRKYDWLYEQYDGDFSSIALNQFAVEQSLETLKRNYSNMVSSLAQDMQGTRMYRHFLKISETKPRTLQQRLENMRYKRKYGNLPEELGDDEPVPEFNFDL